MLLDARAVTALRTGAVAAVAARGAGRADAATVGIVGCGLHGAWTARCLAAAGYGPGVCFDPPPRCARRARERARAGAAGTREDALRRATSSSCVTPGHEPVVERGDLRPGLHLNMLGADGPGKAEATIGAVARARCSATSGRRPRTAAS